MSRAKIEHILLMGDSLSDEGEMSQRRLFGLIPMAGMAGLKGTSPHGRFNNGYSWDDQVLVNLANEYDIRQLEKQREGASDLGSSLTEDALVDGQSKRAHKERRSSLGTDIADGLIDGDPEVTAVAEHSYSLDLQKFHNNLRLVYQGQVLGRSYCQGGATAGNYAWQLSKSISRFFSRIILYTLDQKRREVLHDDIEEGRTPEEKAKTLVAEWTGANDLITVNARPSEAAAEKAIAARIKNVEVLMRNGYKHFVLFNLPDLGLTPRFQKKGGAEKENATRVSNYFNQRLAEEVQKLAAKLEAEGSDCSIELFDVAKTFKQVYDNPVQHGFDPAKQRTPYKGSRDFRENPNHTSPEKGYSFWDDVHPIMLLQSIMSNVFYDFFSIKYNFVQPRVTALQEVDEATKRLHEEQLLDIFKEQYQEELAADKNGCFGFFRRSRMPETTDLADAIQHALYKRGHRSFKVMRDLGWFDEQKQLIPDIPALKAAFERASAKEADQVAPLDDNRLAL